MVKRIIFTGSILHKIGILFLFLLIVFWLAVSVFNFLMFLGNNVLGFPTAVKNNVRLICFTTSVILTVGLALHFMKNDSIIRILIKSVIIIYFSSLVAVILAFLFGNSALWYLKYTIGVIVGGISFLLRIRFVLAP